jgi:ElaB/YqjD/DUF883 family membrane-anchored ribosome-binding protein
MTDTQNPPFGSEAATASDDAIRRVAQGAHTIVDRVAEKAGPAVERLRSGVNTAAESVRSGTSELTDLQQRWLEGCRTCVRDHPLASIGVAVAAGMIVSRLLERER